MRWPSSLAQLAVAQCPVASPGIACRSRIGRTLNQVKGDKVNKGRVRPQNAARRRQAGRRLGNAATCPPIGAPGEGSGLADVQHRVRTPVAPPGGRRRPLRPPLELGCRAARRSPVCTCATDRRATGTADRPHSATVATIARNVTGRIVEAPPTCFAASCADKRRRGGRRDDAARAIHPVNSRSPLVRLVRRVARSATSGRVISTRTATSPSVGSTRWLSDAAATVAEMDTNSTPIISRTSVSKNGRRGRDVEAKRMTATASDTSGWNAAPSSSSGLTSLVNAPAMKPAGSKMIKCRAPRAARQHLRTGREHQDQAAPNKT